MANRTFAKHYLRVIRRWPKDNLRGINVQDALRRHIEQHLLHPTTTAPQTPSTPNPTPLTAATTTSTTTPATTPTTTTTTTTPPNPHPTPSDTHQLTALYSLLSNRYSQKYPTSPDLLAPAFNPAYYTALAAEMDAAPRRSWLGRVWLRWSKVVRLS